MDQPYSGTYRAKALSLSNGSLTVLVPQVFGEIAIVVTDFTGAAPEASEMGWVIFQSGDPEHPVWVSRTAGGGSGEGAQHRYSDEPPTDLSHQQLWFDKDLVVPVASHSGLSGLTGDDHPQYLLPTEVLAGTNVTVTRPGDGTVSIAASGVTVHSGLTGLAADDHTQYLTEARQNLRIFANNTARDAWTPVDGSMALTIDTFKLWVRKSGAWVAPPGTVLHQGTASADIGSQTSGGLRDLAITTIPTPTQACLIQAWGYVSIGFGTGTSVVCDIDLVRQRDTGIYDGVVGHAGSPNAISTRYPLFAFDTGTAGQNVNVKSRCNGINFNGGNCYMSSALWWIVTAT